MTIQDMLKKIEPQIKESLRLFEFGENAPQTWKTEHGKYILYPDGRLVFEPKKPLEYVTINVRLLKKKKS
jgi:hypothetical protein